MINVCRDCRTLEEERNLTLSLFTLSALFYRLKGESMPRCERCRMATAAYGVPA